MNIEPCKRYQVDIDTQGNIDADFDSFNVLIDPNCRFGMIENTIFRGFYLQAGTLRVGSPPMMLPKNKEGGAYLNYKVTEIKPL